MYESIAKGFFYRKRDFNCAGFAEEVQAPLEA